MDNFAASVSQEVFTQRHMVPTQSPFGCSYPCIRQGGCVFASKVWFLCFDPGILSQIFIKTKHSPCIIEYVHSTNMGSLLCFDLGIPPVMIIKPLHGYILAGESAQSLYNQFLVYQCAMPFLVVPTHKAIYAVLVHKQFIKDSALSVGSCFLGSSGRPPPSHYTAFELACLDALMHSLCNSFRFEVKVHVELIQDHWGYSNWLSYEVLGIATEFAILPCGQVLLGSLEWPPPPHVPHGSGHQSLSLFQ